MGLHKGQTNNGSFKKEEISAFKGKKHTPKANQLNRESHLGKNLGHTHGFKKGINVSPLTQFKKGFIPWNKGIKQENISGEKHYNWKGGVTPIHNQIRGSIEYSIWSHSVMCRDNFTDQKTGIRGGKLVAHHILNFSLYPELRFAIDNGITLSLESHREFHKIYGKKNNSREQLEEFISIIPKK